MSSKPENFSSSNDEPMAFIEPNTHSFILKLWLDDQASNPHKAIWRGHITHIASGERHHFDSFRDIVALLAPYLEQMDIKLSLFWRVYLWLIR